MENTNTEATAAAVITVKRAELADALAALKFKQSKRGRIPILSFAAAEIAAGALTLKATDLQTAVTCKIKGVENKAYKGGAFCMSLSDLTAAIKGAPKKGDIEIKYSGGARSETLRACVDYHNMQALFNAIGFTASTEDDRHFLNGIFFDGKEAVTTDGRRLSVLPFRFDFKPKDKENGFIVPTDPIRRAAKIKGAGKMSVYAGMVYFETPKMTISARLVEGNFPAYKQILPKTWEAITTIDGAALLPVLSALPGINKVRSLGVTFLFTAAGYELYFKNEKIAGFPLLDGAAHFKAKALKMSFNPAFVRDILAAAPGNVQMRFNSECSPAGLFNGNGAEYMIMPLRTENAGGALAVRMAELAEAEKPKEAAQIAPAAPEAPKAPEVQPEPAAAVQEAPAPAPEPVEPEPVPFTAGPWYTKNSPSGKQGLIISEKTGETVAVVYDNKNSGPLSAALDLLEALDVKDKYRVSAILREHGYNYEADRIDAAVRKAEGK